jgi:hypothetical protein
MAMNDDLSSGAKEYQERLRRHYEYSPLPLMNASPNATSETLLAIYAQICDTWRTLTDVRFKLLALVPPVAALALFAVITPKGLFEGAGDVVRVMAAIFGLLVSLALYIYDQRNSELYNDLVSRGRRAEMELGLDTGIFLGRKDPKPGSLIKHGTATTLIYWTVLAAWIFAIPVVLSS